ncbi:hypothetical protein Q1695_006833 [Nippostrongylus brasiliensis]|nr:hypothetical protein Q1695_006833 [Nippostrongylus brasiliensis]
MGRRSGRRRSCGRYEDAVDRGAAASRAMVDAEVVVAQPEPIVEEAAIAEQPVVKEAAVAELRPIMELPVFRFWLRRKCSGLKKKRVFDRTCASLRAEISRYEEGLAAVARSRSGALLIQEERLLQAEANLEEVMRLVFEANADKRWMEKSAQKIRQRNASLQK